MTDAADDAVTLVRRYLEAVAAHDWVSVDGCLDADVVRTGPFGDTFTPRDRYVEFLAGLMPTLEGYAMRVDRVVAAGGVVTAELTETVTVQGTPVDTPEALVFDVDDRPRITRIAIYIQRTG